MRERLKSARDALADLAYVIGRALGRIPRSLGRGFGDFWNRLTVIERRRLLAALGAAVVILLFLALAVPQLPCEFPGGDACAPEDNAAELVPADALAYVHVDLDPDSDQMELAGDLADATPVLSQQLVSRALALLANWDCVEKGESAPAPRRSSTRRSARGSATSSPSRSSAAPAAPSASS